MIITKKVKLKITDKNIEGLILNGYINIKKGQEIEIDTIHLSKGSQIKIEVKCDVCGKERNNLMYKEYLRNLRSGGYYSCAGKCSTNKNISTNLEKYGVEHTTQLESTQEKMKNTSIEKYGVDNYTKTDKFKDEFKLNMLERFGVDNPSKHPEFQEKRRNTFLERYGVEHYFLAKDFKHKSEITCMINYGVTHNMMLREHVAAALKTKGQEFQTDEYKIFKNKVYNLTKKNKKELLDKWDGYDYYDREYIKDNFSLNALDTNYPTIDHILCINEGYKNNITPEELAKIENLCFTKRRINSSKSNKSIWIFLGIIL